MREQLVRRMERLAEKGGPAAEAFARIAAVESQAEPPPQQVVPDVPEDDG